MSLTKVPTKYDDVPLGEVVSQLEHLCRGEESDYDKYAGRSAESEELIDLHYTAARDRVLAAYRLTRDEFKGAIAERLGDSRVAAVYGSLV